MLAQHAGLRIEQRQRGDVGAAAAPQRRRDRAEQRARVEVRDHGVGDLEQQVELVALALEERLAGL